MFRLNWLKYNDLKRRFAMEKQSNKRFCFYNCAHTMHTLNATLPVSNSSWLWRAFPKSVDRRLKVKLCVILFIQRSAKPALLSCEIQFFTWRIQSSGFAWSEPSIILNFNKVTKLTPRNCSSWTGALGFSLLQFRSFFRSVFWLL